jgi:hypothetical protein
MIEITANILSQWAEKFRLLSQQRRLPQCAAREMIKKNRGGNTAM